MGTKPSQDTGLSKLTGLVIISAGVCAAVVIGVVLMELPATTSQQQDALQVIAGPSETDAAAVVDLGDPDLNIELSQGGWVQIAGPDGALAQQYRFDHLDPDPDDLARHWLRMTAPHVQMFLHGGRMVTLTGQTLDAYAPKRALEQGKLLGDVVIRLYEKDPAHPTADPTDGEPAMVFRTAEASFDNLAGRIECPGDIQAVSPTERLAGRDLLVLLNDRDDRIEFLRMAEVDYLVLQESSLPGATGSVQARTSRGAITKAALQGLGSPQPRPSDASDVDFYHVRLAQDVRIDQEDQAGRRLAVADTLDVFFSMQSTAAASPGPASVARLAGTLGTLGDLALAARQDSPVPAPAAGEIVVTCNGPLIMVPAPEGTILPPTADDNRLELHGSPVRLLDTSDRMGALCTTLQYQSQTDRIDLVGSDTHPVTVVTDDLWLRTEHLWAEMDTGLAGSGSTPGRADMLAQSPLTAALLNEDAALIDPEAPRALEQDLSIEWTDGVDVRFEPGGASGAGQMKMVLFKGNVQVRSVDGEIDANSLEMRFTPDEQGQAHPDRMLAIGDVRAHNEDQTLWANTLTATLEPPAAAVESEEDAPEAAQAVRSTDPMADARIKDFNANGNVQVLLADGARAFADTLNGDARQEVVTLKGDNIVVARSDLLIEHGREIRIERKEGRADWPGGGLARLLARPINVTQDKRIVRPDVPAPTPEVKRVVTMQARWNDALVYDASFGNGAGALDLMGQVSVVAQQEPTERASLAGERLRLEFTSIAEAPDAKAPQQPNSSNLFSNEGRVLSRLIATTEARLERRTWPTAKRAMTPEIIYIGGDRVIWNDLDASALVSGNGTLVTRQPQWAATGADGPFRGAGIARFTWSKALDMKRQDDDRFHIDMRGMVEGMWKGADGPDDMATLTADAVTALTRRTAAPTEDAPKPNRPAATDTPLNFDGDASIERIIATGRVYLATPTRKADADRLEYNTRTGIARLDGRKGHPVAIMNQGAPLPVRATAMIWNMDPHIDTITLESARGSR